MKRKSGKPKNAKPNDLLRQEKFRELYLQTGNAFQSSKDAGYSDKTAKTDSWRMARAVRVSLADALRARGIDEVSQAQKLAELQQAETVKWNPSAEEFEVFGDSDVQFRATQEINRLLDAYPAPKEITGDNRPIQIIFPSNFSNLISKSEAGD
jgi:hypothetical protein